MLPDKKRGEPYLQGELAGLHGFREMLLLQEARRQIAVQLAQALCHSQLHLLLDRLHTGKGINSINTQHACLGGLRTSYIW